MPPTQATTGRFAYRGDPPEQTPLLRRLAETSAVEPLLRKWREHGSPGLIDANGKIRNVFTKSISGREDPVSQVIREINAVPEAVADFEAAWQASEQFDAIHRPRRDLEVLNARELTAPSLDTNGFVLAQHTSRVHDWTDEQQIATVYYEEMAALVKRLTGARYAFANNHLRRVSQPATGGDGPLARLMAQSRGPVLGPHNDFTDTYGEGLIRTVAAGGEPHTQTFGLTEAMLAADITEDQLRDSRILVINTWRSVGAEPLRRYPLAVADRRTVPPESLGRFTIGKRPSGEPRGGIEVFSATYAPEHRWYYYPEMTPTEVLLWKGYDSAEAPPRPTLHTAFEDLNTPADAAERESVEARVLCLLDA